MWVYSLLRDASFGDAHVGHSIGASVGDDALLKELNEVRRSRIAYDDEEHSPGISALGAAFRDYARTIYAISIPVPISRFVTNRDAIGPLLLVCRDRVATLVGGRATGGLRISSMPRQVTSEQMPLGALATDFRKPDHAPDA